MNFNIDNLPDGAVQGCVTGDEIEKMNAKLKAEGKTGIVYDPHANTDDKSVNPVEHLVDVNDVLGGVEKILEYMCDDDMIAMNENDNAEYQNHI